jgi:hypothetical protein
MTPVKSRLRECGLGSFKTLDNGQAEMACQTLSQEGCLIKFTLAFPHGMEGHRDNRVKLLPFKPGIAESTHHQITKRTHETLIPAIFESLHKFPDESFITASGNNDRKVPALPFTIRALKNPLHRV